MINFFAQLPPTTPDHLILPGEPEVLIGLPDLVEESALGILKVQLQKQQFVQIICCQY